jgi:hypothetical protein
METIQALDDDRHHAQKETLLRHADYLANKAAAAHQIPTPWKQYVIGSATCFFFIASLANAQWEHYHSGIQIYPSFWVMASYGVMLGFPVIYESVVYFRHTRRERARFIAEGCPADFVTRPPSVSQAFANFGSAAGQLAKTLVASARSRRRR